MKHSVVIYKDKLYCWVFSILVLTAELSLVFQNIYTSFMIYLFIFISSLVIASLKYQQPAYSLYVSLALIPLIRTVSISIPLSGIPKAFEHIAVSIPLFLAGAIIARIADFTYTDLGLRFDQLQSKLLTGLLGILLGFLRFLIIQPGKADVPAAPEGLLMWILILIFLGFLEEFIYRGIIYNAFLKVLSQKKAVYFTSFLYAALTISTKSFVNVLIAFLVSIIFCGLYTRQKSLTGLYIAHGLMNLTLYFICPLIFDN